MKSRQVVFWSILLFLVVVESINPMDVVSEAENAQTIAINEGYKAASALGKLTDGVRPGRREVHSV